MVRHIAVTPREKHRRYGAMFDHPDIPRIRLATAREIARFIRSEGLDRG